MAIVQIVVPSGQNIVETPHFTAADRWDGYAEALGKDFPDGKFQGYSLNWGSYDSPAYDPFQNKQYSGYTTNWNSQNIDGTIGAFANQLYAGYTTNWGQYSDQPITTSSENLDPNTIKDFPKDQTTYYKLKGYNPLTETYEVWVVSHDITGRPPLDGGLFNPNPGESPPNVERDVFKTPPSGNTLTGIIIVARWME